MYQRLFLLFLLFVLYSCIDFSDSKNEILKESTNYEGMKSCILFIKSGGATVGDSYQISVRPRQYNLKDSDTGNVFIADDHDGAIGSDTSRVNFEWLSFDTLKISFDKKLRVFKMDSKTEGAIIIYDSLSLTK